MTELQKIITKRKHKKWLYSVVYMYSVGSEHHGTLPTLKFEEGQPKRL
jgi:hypothetical protein